MPLLRWVSELDRDGKSPLFRPLSRSVKNGDAPIGNPSTRTGPGSLRELALEGEAGGVEGEASAPHHRAGGEGGEQEVLRSDRHEERDHPLGDDRELLEVAEAGIGSRGQARAQ